MEKPRFLKYTKLLTVAGALYLSAFMLPSEASAQTQNPTTPDSSPAPSLIDTKPPSFIRPRSTLPPPIFRPASVTMPVAPEFTCSGSIVNLTHYDLPGNLTASGEVMDNNAYTAAIPLPQHRRFGEKLGDKIRVTDPQTRRQIVLRVNDVGLMGNQEYPDLYLDVPIGIAQEMGWVKSGVVPICLEILKD